MIINTNTLLIIIINFPFTYILDCLNIFNFTSYTLTSIILLVGISFYIFKGIKRGLKILIPVTNAAVRASQTYLNYLQIQEMRRNDNNNTDKDINKDVPKDKSVDQKPSPKS
jgi:hypothetical protein